MAWCCDDVVGPIALAFLTGLRDALDECGRPACRTSLVPGAQVAHDVCCECCAEDGSTADGQAWVRVVSVYPVGERFPGQMGVRTNCRHEWAAEIEVGIVRCVHTLTDDGGAPCAADLDADATKLLADAAVMRRVVECVGADLFDECRAILPGRWTPVGPLGGCAGGTMTVTVAFSDVAGCPDD